MSHNPAGNSHAAGCFLTKRAPAAHSARHGCTTRNTNAQATAPAAQHHGNQRGSIAKKTRAGDYRITPKCGTNGQYTNRAGPTKFFSGTGPQ